MEPVIRAVGELKSTSESMSGSVKRMEEELSKTADIFAKHSTRYETYDQKLATFSLRYKLTCKTLWKKCLTL